METISNPCTIICMPRVVCDVHDVPQGTWKLFEISKGGFSNDKYNIYVLYDGNHIYMKPSCIYPSCEFENLFGFKLMSTDYDSEKTIMVKDKTYYKQFVDYFDHLQVNNS